MRKLAVIGAGSWGTAAAALAAANIETTLWARRAELADVINNTGTNPAYLPDFVLPERLSATSNLDAAIDRADVVAMAVPSHGFRAVFAEVSERITSDVAILSLTKGIEQQTLAPMTRVVTEEAPQLRSERIGVLTGPNLAAEIALGQPAAAVVAMKDMATATEVQTIFMSPVFRVYTNDDVVGCEMAGALKNVMAIAAGMSDGMGFGDNTRATHVTRALAELTRLGVAMGGQPSTFAGLAGMGDLIATCASPRSRNHRVGAGLAAGKKLEEIVDDMQMVAEGVKTTRAVVELAKAHRVEVPIATHVGLVLYEGLDPHEAVLRLMTREAKPE